MLLLLTHALATPLGTPAWIGASDQPESGFGWDVAGAGDVDGDGYDDVVVGAPFYAEMAAASGAVWWYRGGPDGLAALPAWSTLGGQGGATLGAAVAGAGDTNGDGYADLLAGAPGYDDVWRDGGQASVWLGSASGPEAAPVWQAEGDGAGCAYGGALTGAGDLDGDGYDDIVVTEPEWDSAGESRGRVSLYPGSDLGPRVDASWHPGGEDDAIRYGWAVAGAHDVNGDGYDDLFVSAYHYPNAREPYGRVYLYEGGSEGAGHALVWTADGDVANGTFGYAIAGPGDVDGDGYADLVVGGPQYDADERGRVWLYRGSAGWPGGAADGTVDGDQDLGQLGSDVAGAGDVNGDGYPDVLVGSRGRSEGESYEGALWVYLGGPDLLGASAWWGGDSDQAEELLGSSVAGAGDVDGDGYADVLGGAPQAYGDGRGGRALLWRGPTGDADADGDGHGPEAVGGDDCDDTRADVYGGALELCDGVDQDCDGVVDDGATTPGTIWRDTDGDGYGDPAGAFKACPFPAGASTNADDCDDARAGVHPGAVEVCGGGDDDCDGLVDEADPDLDLTSRSAWYPDADGDGHGAPGEPTLACAAPPGTAPDDRDCDDVHDEVGPDVAEVCGNGHDDDCDAVTGDVCAEKAPACGCAAGQGRAGWAGGLLLLLARRRRAAPAQSRSPVATAR